MTPKFLFDKTASFDELKKYLPPSAAVTREFTTVDKDLQKWNVIAWSTTELPNDVEERFIDLLYMRIFPVK